MFRSAFVRTFIIAILIGYVTIPAFSMAKPPGRIFLSELFKRLGEKYPSAKPDRQQLKDLLKQTVEELARERNYDIEKMKSELAKAELWIDLQLIKPKYFPENAPNKGKFLEQTLETQKLIIDTIARAWKTNDVRLETWERMFPKPETSGLGSILDVPPPKIPCNAPEVISSRIGEMKSVPIGTQRASERPYQIPKGTMEFEVVVDAKEPGKVKIIRTVLEPVLDNNGRVKEVKRQTLEGKLLSIEDLPPGRYLYIVTGEGKLRIVPESSQPTPNRKIAKHGDLAPADLVKPVERGNPASYKIGVSGDYRGPAKLGGEFMVPETKPGEPKPTFIRIGVNGDSSYMFPNTRADGVDARTTRNLAMIIDLLNLIGNEKILFELELKLPWDK